LVKRLKRVPLGVTFLSIYYVASGLYIMAAGALFILGALDAPKMFLIVGDIAGLLMLAYGLLQILIGWGLYNLRRWAWFVALASNLLSIPLALMYAEYVIAFVNSVVTAYLLLQYSHYIRFGMPKTSPTKTPKAPALGHFIKIKDLREAVEYKFVKRKR